MEAGESSEVLGLFKSRSPEAIPAAQRIYNPYLMSVARNILGDERDAEECVNDAYLAAWNAIPPEEPARMGAYLARLTRNLCIDRLRRDRAARRGGGEAALVLEELRDVASGSDGPEELLEAQALKDAVRRFLDGLPKGQRLCFIRRYWYLYPIRDIAASEGVSVMAIKSRLARIRGALRDALKKEGFDV